MGFFLLPRENLGSGFTGLMLKECVLLRCVVQTFWLDTCVFMRNITPFVKKEGEEKR